MRAASQVELVARDDLLSRYGTSYYGSALEYAYSVPGFRKVCSTDECIVSCSYDGDIVVQIILQFYVIRGAVAELIALVDVPHGGLESFVPRVGLHLLRRGACLDC